MTVAEPHPSRFFQHFACEQEGLLLCVLIGTMILVILNDKSEMKHFVCLIPQILWLWYNSHKALALHS